MRFREKRELLPNDKEYILHVLDNAYEMREPLSIHLKIFEEFDITTAERNQIILESEYKNNPDLVSALILFGQ